MSNAMSPPEVRKKLQTLRLQSRRHPAVEAAARRAEGQAADAATGRMPPPFSAVVPPAAPRMVVAIPSVNRGTILPGTVRSIIDQKRWPDLLILSVTKLEDLGDLDPEALPFPVEIIIGKKGGTVQRNRALEIMRPSDILLFLDDDFLMAPDFLQRTLELFDAEAGVVVATGTVFADGIHGPGFDHERGGDLLRKLEKQPATETISPIYAGYGCNLALRASHMLENNVRFDESLPLYGWLEDVDFSRRLAPYGDIVKSGAMRGVHLGTKTGRTPGVFLGYSQVANPHYLFNKGTMSRRHAYEMVVRNILSNLLHSVYPPKWADFRGRLRGNILAAKDIWRGQATPLRILDLTP